MNDKFTATPVSREAYEIRVLLDPDKREIDVRYADRMGPGRTPYPNKRGLTFDLADLPDLVDSLICAEGKAKELGLIGGGVRD